MRRPAFPLLLAASAATFLGMQWLRWPEPPGIDQSLFVYYGEMLRYGLSPYRDLWDSKPPGLFALYSLADWIAGPAHAPRLLDAIAAAASAVLVFRLLRRELEHAGADRVPSRFVTAGAWVAAFLAASFGCAPIFASPRVTGQPEVLAAPLVLGAVLASLRPGARAAFLAGALLGVAACTKLTALLLLPLPWIFAPARSRAAARRAAVRAPRLVWVLAGWLLPVAVCVLWMALCGALGEAMRAVLVFPRAYAAEISSRVALGPALVRGTSGIATGIPMALALAVVGAVAPPRRPLALPALAWLGLAFLGAVAQRQIVDYQVFACTTPLAVLGGRGAGHVARWVVMLARSLRAGRTSSTALLAGIVASFVVLSGIELRAARRQYAAHLAYRAGKMDRREFVLRQGRPGLLWLEAEEIRASLREAISTARAGDLAPGRAALLVWGLAPAVYALSGCEPATRYVFHQTLLVEGSALSQRWPDAGARRTELLARMRDAPPRFVVVVHGDRSGLEPRDSAAELQDFPELARILAVRYARVASTGSHELLERDRVP